MNNGPALVMRGAILGCVMVCILVALITTSQDSNSSTALAAALPAAEQPSAKTNVSNKRTAESAAKTEATDQSKAKQPAKKNKQQNINCTLAASYPQSILQWCGLIDKAAKQNGLPANLLAALILQESGGDAQAYSHSGAVGLMQVMPRDGIAASFQCANGPCFASRPTIAELLDPAYNIDYGTRFLAGLVERRGSLREALYAYGPIGMGYAYADKVLAIYASHGGD